MRGPRMANAWLGGVAVAALLDCGMSGHAARGAETPVTAPGFTLEVFAHAPEGASRPDSLAIVNGNVWVGYGGTGKPDGSGGAKSQIVAFGADGKVVRNLTVVGHNDGLRLDPSTGKLWAIQNEDGDANLVLIDPTSGAMEKYTFTAGRHGGGYDDVAFIGDAAYVSASNPSVDNGAKNPGPSVVKAMLQADHTVAVTPVMSGTPEAKDVVTGKTSRLNLTDPDSLAISPAGDLILDSQGDSELLWMKPGAVGKPVIHVLPLLGSVQIDDTAFVTSRTGYLLFADTKADLVYKLAAPVWVVGTPFSASNGVEASTNPPAAAIPAYIGQLNLRTGALLPVAEHLVSPHGMIFVATK